MKTGNNSHWKYPRCYMDLWLCFFSCFWLHIPRRRVNSLQISRNYNSAAEGVLPFEPELYLPRDQGADRAVPGNPFWWTHLAPHLASMPVYVVTSFVADSQPSRRRCTFTRGNIWKGAPPYPILFVGGGQAQTHSLLPQELWHGFPIQWSREAQNSFCARC